MRRLELHHPTQFSQLHTHPIPIHPHTHTPLFTPSHLCFAHPRQVFLRDGMLAAIIARHRGAVATRLAAWWRRVYARRRFVRLRRAVVAVQAAYRALRFR